MAFIRPISEFHWLLMKLICLFGLEGSKNQLCNVPLLLIRISRADDDYNDGGMLRDTPYTFTPLAIFIVPSTDTVRWKTK
ncbi:MAG: hypothetical protein ACJ712_00920 [Nitrososphaeraceae archaeon]